MSKAASAPVQSPDRPGRIASASALRTSSESSPPGASIRAMPANSGSGSSTYISTPWQSTTSKLPGRKCTPVSRPSPSMIRIRSRIPSGSDASDRRASAIIVESCSRPVT